MDTYNFVLGKVASKHYSSDFFFFLMEEERGLGAEGERES